MNTNKRFEMRRSSRVARAMDVDYSPVSISFLYFVFVILAFLFLVTLVLLLAAPEAQAQTKKPTKENPLLVGVHRSPSNDEISAGMTLLYRYFEQATQVNERAVDALYPDIDWAPVCKKALSLDEKKAVLADALKDMKFFVQYCDVFYGIVHIKAVSLKNKAIIRKKCKQDEDMVYQTILKVIEKLRDAMSSEILRLENDLRNLEN